MYICFQIIDYEKIINTSIISFVIKHHGTSASGEESRASFNFKIKSK